MCSMHRARKSRGMNMDAPPPPEFATPEDRFWSHVDRRGADECWPWTSARTRGGYGTFATGLRHGWGSRASRIAYQLAVGPIPNRALIDHTCHDPKVCTPGECAHRLCCNPAHLEPVTPRENVLRGGSSAAVAAARTHCAHGHAYTPENTIVTDGRGRRCRTCRREQARTR